MILVSLKNINIINYFNKYLLLAILSFLHLNNVVFNSNYYFIEYFQFYHAKWYLYFIKENFKCDGTRTSSDFFGN